MVRPQGPIDAALISRQDGGCADLDATELAPLMVKGELPASEGWRSSCGLRRRAADRRKHPTAAASIPIPAACCCLFELKPTRVRTPAGPDVGEGWAGMLGVHAVSRTVRDSALLLDCPSGPDYVRAVQGVHALGRVVAGFFEHYDVMLAPTMPVATNGDRPPLAITR